MKKKIVKSRMFCVFVALLVRISFASPICEELYGYAEVAEDTAVGTVVKEIRCQKSRIGEGQLSYFIKDGNTHGKFAVNTTNDVGEVYVYQSISFESRTTNFQLSIEVTESGSFISTTNYVLDIQITGVNDYAPLFLFSPYTVYVNEDMKPGTIIFNAIPYDFDKGADGVTTSVILDGDDTLFYMDPQTAKVYLRSNLDYERQNQYVLTIQVTDNGMPTRRSSTTLLNINVKDMNDNPPVCEESYISETFDETKEAGSVIKFLKCSDADQGYNGRLSYAITEGDYTKFRLQGPYLILSREIDVDTEPSVWSLTVIVRDRGSPRLSALIDIVIFVEGVDDNAPVWAPPENGNYVVNIEEHSPVGQLVVHVSADDLDADDNDALVVYYMDDYSNIFTIKPTTGDIFLSQELDREKASTYTLPISAVSHNNPTDRISTNVIVNVIDANDNTPEFEKDVFQVFVSETLSAKSEIATITAVDVDDGNNGVVLYKIVGGNTDSLFDIQSKTGVISLAGNLDFESKVAHTFYIRASDRGRPSRWSTCTVIVSVLPENEFVPIFKETEIVVIAEDTPIGTSVFSVQATDNDAGDDGTLSYSLGSIENAFVIESRTGLVRLMETLDRETITDFEVEIFATDMSNTFRKTASINVRIQILDRNDNEPVCEKRFYSKDLIPPITSGDVIQSLNCSDADTGGNSKLSYFIVSGNTNSDFSMSADGKLVVMQKPKSSLYRLQIRVTDNGSPPLETFVLIVLRVGGTPEIRNLPTKLSILESTNIGVPFFEVQATSVSQDLEYFIKSVTSDRSETTLLSEIVKIDRVSGKCFIWNELDREEISHYTIAVGVKDKISNKKTEEIIELTVLDENDNSPKFQKSIYNISLMENIKVGTDVINLVAYDRDINENSELSFDIVEGNEDNSFVIDKGGVVKIRGVIDREKYDTFTLTVTATDNSKMNRRTSTTTVLVTILDSDEYIPEFIDFGSKMETHLPEDTPLAAKIFTVTARDLDAHKELTYHIDDASKEHFIIERDSGEIFLSRLLDREKQDLHMLVITAEGNARVITASVTLSVSDINDNDPEFSSNLYKFDVNERSKIGTFIGNINVTDADKGENALLSFAITKGNFGNAFVLQENKIYLSGNLDYEILNEFILEIEARDNGTPQRTSSTSVIVEVTPEYRIPKFAVNLEVIHVTENTHTGYFIYDADATLQGAKEGHGNELMYSIEGGNENGYYSISRSTGEIAIARKFNDKLDNDAFMLHIRAKNIYKTSLSDEMTLKIEIDDVNDNTPVFEKDMYTLNVKENAKIGLSIGSVTASDQDRGENALITYQLIRNEDAETFRIDPFIGTLSLKKELNFMYNTKYQLSVIAFDNGSPRLTGSTYVIVNIYDVNDKPPVFENENLNIKVRENYAIGRTIYQVRAHDGDTGIGGELLYKIVTGNGNGTFELDSESGEITLAKELDREATESYILIIEAEDKGLPSLTGTTTLSVVVTDVNDNIPYFTEPLYEISLDRFSPVETHVLSVAALDSDKGDNSVIEYKIFKDHDELFQIDGKSGQIFTFSELTEANNDIQLYIIATDRGIPRLSSSVTVSIEIYPPLVTETEDFSFAVSEYASPNSFIGAVGSQVSSSSSEYRIVSGNYQKHFRISKDEGNIFLDGVLDRERYSDYYLHVKSTNRLNQNIETDINVHISVTDENDNSPQFSETVYDITVLEHTPIDFSVAKVVASDLDDGSNGKVTYSIINGEGGDARKLFSLDENGSLTVRSSISHEVVDHLQFKVVASDNGKYSRQGSCQVNVKVIDIDDNVINGYSMPSKIINFEMPNTASGHYMIGCLKPSMFGLDVSATKVYYLAQKQYNTFTVARNTGCIMLKETIDLKDGTNFFMWVVAALMTSNKTGGQLALLRVDTFDPVKHVVSLTHSVSKQVLELNRDLLQDQLQEMFPSNLPRIWKTEDMVSPVRRKLLSQGSKSYIYVIRDNETAAVTGVQNRKYFLSQRDILRVLGGPEDGVSHDLTSESFDSFPVVFVQPYTEISEDELRWERTTAGKWTLGVVLSVVIVTIVITIAVYLKIKHKKNTDQESGSSIPSQSVPSVTNKVGPIYNNLRREVSSEGFQSSSTDITPLVNTLKILGGMSEEERNKLIETTLISNKKEAEKDDKGEKFRAKFLKNRMSTVPVINVSHIDETLRTKKLSNDETANKYQNANEFLNKHTAKEPNDLKNIKPFSTNFHKTESPKEVRLSVPDEDSLSCLDLDPTGVKEEPTNATNALESDGQEDNTENGAIVIGGKIYDGVGKDVKSGKKYLYNTGTGDKIYVTDEILKGAIEHRESIITQKFNETHAARISTFKRPAMRRKTSRTRFSTTTIWELNVDNASIAHGVDAKENNATKPFTENEKHEYLKELSAARKRKTGVDYTGIDEYNSGTTDEVFEGKWHEKKNSASSIESVEMIESTGRHTNMGMNDNSNSNCWDNSIKYQENNSNDVEMITTEAGETLIAKNNETKSERSDQISTSAEAKSGPNEKSGFLIPRYKPLNLEKVECKVPKGKSEKKDCLSKDPFYTGWAKIVGRRMSKKAVKRTDGTTKTVTVREGRSLPANIVTQLVQNKAPIYRPQRLMTLDV